MTDLQLPQVLNGAPVDADAWYNPVAEAVQAHEDSIESLLTPGWTAFTPVWTASSVNPSIGNGSITGRYRRPAGGDLVYAEYLITAGSTTAFGTGFWMLSFPPVSLSAAAQAGIAGYAMAYDASTGNRYPCCIDCFTGTFVIGSPTGPSVSSTVPFTWASSDQLRLNINYQPA